MVVWAVKPVNHSQMRLKLDGCNAVKSQSETAKA